MEEGGFISVHLWYKKIAGFAVPPFPQFHTRSPRCSPVQYACLPQRTPNFNNSAFLPFPHTIYTRWAGREVVKFHMIKAST